MKIKQKQLTVTPKRAFFLFSQIQNNLVNNPKVHLLLFFTEGEPKDLGLDLGEAANLFERLAGPYFDSIIVRSPASLVNRDKSWRITFIDRRQWISEQLNQAKYQGKEIKYSSEWAALNFLLWKPRLIHEELRCNANILAHDIIFYHDINLFKYKDYAYAISKWKKYILKQMKNKSVLLFDDNGSPMFADVKQEVLTKYGLKVKQNMSHIWAGAFAVRKDAHGYLFTQEWYDMCSCLENVSPLTIFSDYPGFIWHAQEQACLSVLYRLKVKENSLKKIFLWGKREIPPRLQTVLCWHIIVNALRIKKLTKIIAQKMGDKL